MSFLRKLFHKKDPRELSEASGEEDLFSAEEVETDEEPDILSPISQITDTEADSEEEYEVVEREILPAKIICPDCGGITLEGLEFCDKCGGELL